ncbi:MAG: sugar kinase [Desulfovibrio sp.]|nr:sugar kinase [Desulfovibrio sp.]
MDARKPWLIVGTIPDENLPLVCGSFSIEAETLVFPDTTVPPLAITRGTAALLAAAQTTLAFLSPAAIQAYLIGDTGNGVGSRTLYRHLVSALESMDIAGITFHYCYPDVDWHNRILLAAQPKGCILVADAGFMYAAKMSGYAQAYDLFTPDNGELSFLADPKAPHPFYTRGFLLANDQDSLDRIQRAYADANAAKWLIVKGKEDCIVHQGRLVETVSSPNTPALEAIGGTGDLVTGVVSGLLAAGYPMQTACVTACSVCRKAGAFATPTPATQIAQILPFLPAALAECMTAL